MESRTLLATCMYMSKRVPTPKIDVLFDRRARSSAAEEIGGENMMGYPSSLLCRQGI